MRGILKYYQDNEATTSVVCLEFINFAREALTRDPSKTTFLPARQAVMHRQKSWVVLNCDCPFTDDPLHLQGARGGVGQARRTADFWNFEKAAGARASQETS